MPWLTADAFLDAWGPLAEGLREPRSPTGGEDALAEALRSDPRRLAALVAEPGAGSTRLALELARGFAHAFYPDPRARPDPAADLTSLEERLASVPARERVLVVLDGPDPREATSRLKALLARPVHPGLRVLVPCAPHIARRLSRLGGDYPQGSLLVAALGHEPRPPAPLPAEATTERLLPLALAGRVPTSSPVADPGWTPLGVAAETPDGELVSMLSERHVAAIVEATLLGDDGATRLEALFERAPSLRRPSFETLLHLTDGAPPAALLSALTAFDADTLPDPRVLFERAIPLAPPTLEALAKRAEELVADGVHDARTHAVLAFTERTRGHHEASVAHLEHALAAEPAAIALAIEHAGATRDLEAAEAVVERARATEDHATLALALRQAATLRFAADDPEGAIEANDEWAAVEERLGRVAAAAAARARSATLASEMGDPERAYALASAALADRRAIGEVRGQCFCLYRLAGLAASLRRKDEAVAFLEEALALSETLQDPTGEGYCLWMLGALADKRGDAGAAAEHYAASVEAYSRAGRVPDRLMASLVRARAQTPGADEIAEESGRGVELPDVPDGAVERLVQLGSKPKS